MNTFSFSRRSLSIGLAALLITASVPAAESAKLDEHLEPFLALLGKTWRGQFKDTKGEKPLIDVARWERALNGRAVRVLHSINDGSYGGESIIQWDSEKNRISYYYFSTAGFHTTGTMTWGDGKLAAVEKVTGNARGVTEVRSTYELRADGTLLNKSQYFKDGEPVGSREVHYKEDATGEVRFN